MPESRILMGVIGRPHGVRGLLRVTSYAEDLTAYGTLSDDGGRRFVVRPRGGGVAEVAEVVDGAEVKVEDRTAAERLTRTRLYADRAQLPEPDVDEFYLADLVGLAARDPSGTPLGAVTAVHDYGAGASLEVTRPDAPPLLVPFTRAAVPAVDVAGGAVTLVPPEVSDAESEPPPPPAGGGGGEGAALVPAGSPPPAPLPQGEGE